MDLVEFRCPEHGFVLETYPSAIVHHAVESHDGVAACGRFCEPEGGRQRKSRKLDGMAGALRGRRRSAA